MRFDLCAGQANRLTNRQSIVIGLNGRWQLAVQMMRHTDI